MAATLGTADVRSAFVELHVKVDSASAVDEMSEVLALREQAKELTCAALCDQHKTEKAEKAIAALEEEKAAVYLRAAATSTEEMAIMKSTGLTQEQLRPTRMFTIGEVRSFQKRIERAAASAVAASAPSPSSSVGASAVAAASGASPMPRAVVASVAAALAAKLEESDVNDVAACAIAAVAAGNDDAAAIEAARKYIEDILAPVDEPPRVDAVIALATVDVEAMKQAFVKLLGATDRGAVSGGRTLVKEMGDRTAHPDHAAIASADLEGFADLLFRCNSRLHEVKAMVAAFRCAYEQVYRPAPLAEPSTTGTALASRSSAAVGGAGAMPVPSPVLSGTA